MLGGIRYVARDFGTCGGAFLATRGHHRIYAVVYRDVSLYGAAGVNKELRVGRVFRERDRGEQAYGQGEARHAGGKSMG